MQVSDDEFTSHCVEVVLSFGIGTVEPAMVWYLPGFDHEMDINPIGSDGRRRQHHFREPT